MLNTLIKSHNYNMQKMQKHKNPQSQVSVSKAQKANNGVVVVLYQFKAGFV